VLQLMQAALQLQNHAMVQRLLQLPCAAAITAGSLEALIMALMQRTSRGHVLEGACDTATTLKFLCALPAAQQLQPDAVQRLVAEALQLLLHYVAHQLLEALPAAQQLDGPPVQQILAAVVASHEVPDYDELDENPQPQQWQLHTIYLVQHILDLPGAGQLQPEGLTEHVLQPALRMGAVDLVSRLCNKVPLNAAALEELLQSALQLRNMEAAAALCGAAAAQQLSVDSIRACLEAVLGRCCGGRVQVLRSLAHPGWYATARQGVAKQLLALPAAQELPVDAVAALLDAAVELVMQPLVSDMCALPAASELQPEQLLALMQRALQRRMDKAINTFTKRPAAAQICPEQLSEVMAEAMKLRLSAYALLPLDSLLASQKPPMSRNSYMRLLQTAGQQQCLEWVQELLQMQHAKSIKPALLQQLLEGAVQEQTVMAVSPLCEVPAAAKLTAAAVLPLLEAAVVQSDSGEVVRTLACLPRAGDISGEAAQALVAAALKHRLEDNGVGLLEWLPSVALLVFQSCCTLALGCRRPLA
jgi:hypothetical protein